MGQNGGLHMSSLFEGLEKFGIESEDSKSLFEQKKMPKPVKKVEHQENPVREKDLLLNKKTKCPICEKNFLNKTVKNSKIRRLPSDKDLRPCFAGIDVLKYDVIVCPQCGFAVLNKYLHDITSLQERLIRENISNKFKANERFGAETEVYSYETAIERYKLALLNAVIKKARDSEKAYICLKAGWVMRGQLEAMDKESDEWASKGEQLQKEEEEFMKNAYEGLLRAMEKEQFPMCGMDQDTLEFIVANLAMRFGCYDVSSKIISRIVTSKVASRRIKDKALTLKDELIVLIRNQAQK